jgi:hypothetical protein
MKRKNLMLMVALCLLPLGLVAAAAWIFGLTFASSAWVGTLVVACLLAHFVMMMWMHSGESQSTTHQELIERKQ